MHSPGTTAARGGKRGSREISKRGKLPCQHWEGADVCKERAAVSKPAWHSTASDNSAKQLCTAPAWHPLHKPPRSNHTAQLGTPGATCLQLGWLCHPNSRGTAAPTLAGESGTRRCQARGGHRMGHGRGEEQLNGLRPHGACGNRHHHTLPEHPNTQTPKHLLPPSWHGASARGGHGKNSGGESARARSKKRHVCAWQHNTEQVTSAPAVALLQEASTQASDAALPGEKIKHPPLYPCHHRSLGGRGRRAPGCGGWVLCWRMMARWYHSSAPPPRLASLPRPRKSQGSKIMCVHKHFSSANTPRDHKISRPCTRSRAAPLL